MDAAYKNKFERIGRTRALDRTFMFELNLRGGGVVGFIENHACL
jgi:hypothetical protein